MRSATVLALLGVLLLSTTAAFADKVTTDFDHSVNFLKYKTFMWIQGSDIQDPFMKDRVMASVNSLLRLRGLKLVNDGGDLALDASLVTEEKETWETYYSGDGGWGWGWGGGGFATTTVETYVVGTLTVNMYDGRTSKLLWQGVGVDTLSHKPERRVKEFDKQILKMFKEFPPFSIRETSWNLPTPRFAISGT